jgi:hypothetical protein
LSRIATLAFLEVGYAYRVTFTLKMFSLTRNRLNFGH